MGKEVLERRPSYEANEGARGRDAVRKTNRQQFGNSGGAAVKTTALSSSDSVAMSVNATGNSGSKSGTGIVTRIWLGLY
jgi:hypothetical protein